MDQENTVETLRDQLQKLFVYGHDDAGFPVLARAKDDGGSRLVGYIGANELEHALSNSLISNHKRTDFHDCLSLCSYRRG